MRRPPGVHTSIADARGPVRAPRFNGVIRVFPVYWTAMVLIFAAACWAMEVLSRSGRHNMCRTLGFFSVIYVAVECILDGDAIVVVALFCPAVYFIFRLLGHRAAAPPIVREVAHRMGYGTMYMRAIPRAAPATCSASSLAADVVVQLSLDTIGLPTW